jgi:hypothetical protein
MSIKHIMPEIKNYFKDQSLIVAELGILHGEGIPVFFDNLNINRYYGVDAFINYEENKDGSYQLMKNHGNTIYTNIKEKYKTTDKINIIKGFTSTVVNDFEDNFFDLVFIDAGHEYEQVSSDIKLWHNKVKENGILSGDDYFYPPVKRAVHEFIEKHDYKLYTSINKNPDKNYNYPWSWYIFKH